MSKGDEFREKYYAALDEFLTKPNNHDHRFRKAWTENFSKANMREIKEYLAPFATTLDQVMERVTYDLGKQKSKQENERLKQHKL